ncbi:MAG TPA: protein kinase [Candidatus Saccharimonadales bacterium]|nr:protein kinase [Candidatus Saccharimonadales bacterium]
MSLSAGDRLGTFEIRGVIGAGGMGIVYRATDTRLKREVAIKVLPDALVADPSRLTRFQREARALASLNHPNVVTIHAVDEVEGIHFLVMELAEGRSLDQFVSDGPLTLGTFFEIVVPLVDAVAAAHSRGITHRDLKPANVMVADSKVKVLDFGVAKLADAGSDLEHADTQTQQGLVVGTLPYMSPEQIEARGVDTRSDIFSLGIIMYELLTGGRPFKGDSGASLLSAILKDTPPLVSDLRPQVPPPVARAIQRCLEKKPDRRYQSSGDLLRDLRAAEAEHQSGAISAFREPVSPDKTIAVLPFVNMSADPDNEFFSDGISEEIISALAQIPDLHVTARTSSFAFKGKNLDLRQVGEELNVQTVLEGSVRRAGKRIRITAQLINVADGYQLWSERYDREMEDVFEIQDEIARTIADRLKVTLKGDARAPLVKAGTDNVEAYELYLRGRQYWHLRSPSTLRVAIRCFERTIELDPGYALAYAGLADCYGILRVYGWISAEESRPQAHAAASRAMSLAPELWETNFSQAFYIFYFERAWRDAEPQFQKAIDISPRSPLAQVYYGLFLATARRADEAIARLRRAQELDPLSPFIHGLATVGYHMVGAFEEADRAGSRALELQPDYLLALWLRGVAVSGLGRHADALESLERAVALSRAPIFVGVLGAALARAGRREEAVRLLVELEDRSSRGEYVPAFASLAIHTGLGDLPAIRRTLANVLAEATPPLSMSCTCFPALDEYRSDPEISRLLAEMYGQ